MISRALLLSTNFMISYKNSVHLDKKRPSYGIKLSKLAHMPVYYGQCALCNVHMFLRMTRSFLVQLKLNCLYVILMLVVTIRVSEIIATESLW